MVIKTDNFDETSRKLLFQVADFYFFVFHLKRPLVYVLFIMPFIVIPSAALILVPTDTLEVNRQSLIDAISKSSKLILEYLKDIKVNCVGIMRYILEKVNKRNVFSNHPTCGKLKPVVMPLYSVIYNLIVVPSSIVSAIVMFLVTSILCLAIFSPYFIFLAKLIRSNTFSIHHRIFFIYSTVSATIFVTFSCQFAVRMLGFVIMGTILNLDFVSAYVTFVFVLVKNIYDCYCNTQNKYKEVKDIIAEKWPVEENKIPEELFYSVTDKVLPIFKEILVLLCKILAIAVFLTIALTAILLFNVTYASPAIVQIISVFVSGKLSEVVFSGIAKGSKFVGQEKIRLEKEITLAVEEYLIENGIATTEM